MERPCHFPQAQTQAERRASQECPEADCPARRTLYITWRTNAGFASLQIAPEPGDIPAAIATVWSMPIPVAISTNAMTPHRPDRPDRTTTRLFLLHQSLLC
jgi:hypothetical protein